MPNDLITVSVLNDPFARLCVKPQPDLLAHISTPDMVRLTIERDLTDLGNQARPPSLRQVVPDPLQVPPTFRGSAVSPLVGTQGGVSLQPGQSRLTWIALSLRGCQPNALFLPGGEIGTGTGIAPIADQAVTALNEWVLL